jgi:DNA-binding response OmpR family regulator
MAERSLRRAALVVEDDGGIRELLRLHLDLAGFTIDEASARPDGARRHEASGNCAT